MITLDELYRDADMHLISVMYPGLEFYRNEKGFLCCRAKKANKKDLDDVPRRSKSPQN